jgi:hypothetical protein
VTAVSRPFWHACGTFSRKMASMNATVLELYHGTKASAVEAIRKMGLVPPEGSLACPENRWTLTSDKEDAWGHARRKSGNDHAVVTYWIPGDQFDDFLYPPLELAPTVRFYSLRQRLPGTMIKYVDVRPG